jgi:hypothetical protein
MAPVEPLKISLLQAIKRVRDLNTQVRTVCVTLSIQNLRTVIAVHRENCRQAGCLVLAAMEARVVERLL